MEKNNSCRRKFIRKAAGTAAGIVGISVLPYESILARKLHINEIEIDAQPEIKYSKPRIRFSVIGLNHGHIYSQAETVINGGGEFVSFFAKEPDLAAAFSKKFPQVKLARSEKEILEDKSIHLVVSAAIPEERAPLGIEVMKHGKDFMSDKPGITSLEQLEEVRRVQKETRRIFSILYGERMENKSTLKAADLAREGAIGKVIHTIGLGPHRMNPESRPAWFFDTKYYGGILVDIASHQFDQYLYITGSTKPEVVASQVGNTFNSRYPSFEDFGDVMLRSEKAAGYLRVDWFTPGGLKTWGDTRLTILGTEGYIEVRKNIDLAGRDGGNHLFLVNKKDTTYIDCTNVRLTYGNLLVDDIINRTETAMTQEHCFRVAELALVAQKKAEKIKLV